MGYADFSYSPDRSVTTAGADPIGNTVAGAGPALSPDYGSLFSEIIKDQYARRQKREALQDALQEQQIRAAMAANRPLPPGSAASLPAHRPMAMAQPMPQRGFAGTGDSQSAEDREEARLRSMQRSAAMSALGAPPMKMVGPDYTQSGFAPHMTMDVARMNAAQRQAFLPQSSQQVPPYAEPKRY